MKLRCKEGDLAIVIRDTPICEMNIGRLVRVRGPLRFDPGTGHHFWLIKPVLRRLYAVEYHHKGFQLEIVYWKSLVEHQDAWLLPIPETVLEDMGEREIQDQIRHRSLGPAMRVSKARAM